MQKLSARSLLYILPILLWGAFIFALSSQTHQKQSMASLIKKEISEKTVATYFAETSIKYGSEHISIKRFGTYGFVEFIIRKFAHLFVYLILGMLLARLINALTSWSQGLNNLLTVLVCMLYAVTDEYHQSFVMGRTSLPIDVILDTIGALFGVLIYATITYIFQSIRKKKHITS